MLRANCDRWHCDAAPLQLARIKFLYADEYSRPNHAERKGAMIRNAGEQALQNITFAFFLLLKRWLGISIGKATYIYMIANDADYGTRQVLCRIVVANFFFRNSEN